MAKKNLIEEALIEARELEKASIENAKDVVLESFTPDFVDFFRDVLNEAEECDDDDDEEMNEEEDSDDDEEELDETDHDMGKLEDDEDETAHDLGKGFANEEYEYLDEEYDYIDEGEYDDVDGEAYPESEEYLPSEDRPKVKQTGNSGWEDEGSAGYAMSGPENGKSPMPGGTPKAKQTGEGGWEEEHWNDDVDDPERGGKNGLDNVPTAKIVRELNARGILEDEDVDVEDLADDDDDDVNEGDLYEDDLYEDELYEEDLYEEDEDHDEPDDDDEGGPSDDDEDNEVKEGRFYGRSSGIFEDDGEDDSELDVPDELFDDDEDEDEDDEDDDDMNEDDEVDLDVDDDDEDDDNDLDEEVDLYLENDDEDEDDDDEEVNENLYIREGYMMNTPDEYLNSRIDTLTEERSDLIDLVNELQGQLQETHLFNAKLAHMNKLFMTGAFTNTEKERIAEKLDECETLSDVKSLYKTIVSEVQHMNPLDDFSRMIKENTSGGKAKTESIYESTDVRRMRELAGFESDV